MASKTNTISRHYVMWIDKEGTKQAKPFSSKNDAYEFMLSKLSSGQWACFPEKSRIITQER